MMISIIYVDPELDDVMGLFQCINVIWQVYEFPL